MKRKPLKTDFPGGSAVKNLPALQETQDQSLGWEDFPGEGSGNPLQYSSPGKSQGQKSLAGYSPCGLKQAGHSSY